MQEASLAPPAAFCMFDVVLGCVAKREVQRNLRGGR